MIIPLPNEEVIVEKPLEFPYVAIKSAPPKEKVEDKSVEAENEELSPIKLMNILMKLDKNTDGLNENLAKFNVEMAEMKKVK